MVVPAQVLDAAQAKVAVASIASVVLGQDCPDPDPNPETKNKADMAKSPAMDKRRQLRQPCTQSNVQIAFTGQGAVSSVVKISVVRLKSAAGKELTTLVTRMPSLWRENGYEAWDGVLAPDSDHKASYKLSIPDWSAMDAALGVSSFNQMFTIEVDLDIGGTRTTVISPQFERVQPVMIKT